MPFANVFKCSPIPCPYAKNAVIYGVLPLQYRVAGLSAFTFIYTVVLSMWAEKEREVEEAKVEVEVEVRIDGRTGKQSEDEAKSRGARGQQPLLQNAKRAVAFSLPPTLSRRWRAVTGCDSCADAKATPCPRCWDDDRGTSAGGYEAMGGVRVACSACKGTGRTVCRDCFTGDPYDIEKVRERMGYPD